MKNFLKSLVKDRRITARERIAQRLGYMGTGFIMLGPYILSAGDRSYNLYNWWFYITASSLVS